MKYSRERTGLYALAAIGILYIIGMGIIFLISHNEPFIWFGAIDMKAFADYGAHIAGVATFFAFLFAFLSFHEQSKTARIQQFESTFFNMLTHFDSIISSIQIDENNRLQTGETVISKAGIKTGRYALNTLLRDYLKVLKIGLINMDELWDENFKTEDIVYNRWQEMYKSNIYSLPHYFRYYYTIVKFIMTSDLIKDKKKYTDILQAKMSSHEMGLIFYNTYYNPSITNQNGAKKFQEWLNDKEIGLFENIQQESVYDAKDFKSKCKIDFKHL